MKMGLFRLRPKRARAGDMEVHAGEMTIRFVLTSPQPTVAVSGRVTIDSSPTLRSALLDLLCQQTAPILVIDMSEHPHLANAPPLRFRALHSAVEAIHVIVRDHDRIIHHDAEHHDQGRGNALWITAFSLR
jgi:hypothetical protein